MLRMNNNTTKRVVLGSAIATAAFFTWPWKANKIVYPPDNATTKNRIFIPVRNEGELNEILLFKQPLLVNFTIRGDPKCNKLTGSLYRLLSFDLAEKYHINAVDIETDESNTRELMLRYQVNHIPTIICLEKQLPKGKYIDEKLKVEDDIDHEKLLKWVESMALVEEKK